MGEDNDAAAKTESNEEDDDRVNQNNRVNDDDEDEEIDKLAEAFQEQTIVTDTAPNEEDEKEQKAPSDEEDDDDNDDAPEDLKKVAEWIRSGQAKKILVVTGAGCSVAAGIPDFRSPGTGLYDNLNKYNLPYPEAVFDIAFFARNPQPFIQLASELWPGGGASTTTNSKHAKYKPTFTHCFLALLAEKNLLLRVYTQNIDGLDHMGTYVVEELFAVLLLLLLYHVSPFFPLDQHLNMYSCMYH